MLEKQKSELEEHNAIMQEVNEKYLDQLERVEKDIFSAQESRKEVDKQAEQAKKKATRIRWRVEHRRPQYEVYLITLAQNPENQLEITEANQLLQKTVYRRCPEIIGIACGYGEALELVRQLAEATYRKQKNGDIRHYLSGQQEDEACT